MGYYRKGQSINSRALPKKYPPSRRLKAPKGQHAVHKKGYSSHDSLKGGL